MPRLTVALGTAFWLITFGAIGAAQAGELRGFSEQDRLAWRTIVTAQLAPNGHWLAYTLVPDDDRAGAEEVTIVLRSTGKEVERRYNAGVASRGVGRLQMSGDGTWIAFQFASPAQPDLAVGLVATESGQRFDVANVADFAFLGKTGWILLKRPAEGGRYELLLKRPGTSIAMSFPGVVEHALSPQRDRIAWVDADGLKALDVSTGVVRQLDLAQGERHRRLTWSPHARSLAAFREAPPSDDASGAALRRILLIFTELQGRPRKHLFDPNTWQGFPKGYELSVESPPTRAEFMEQSPRAPLVWREDEQGIYFGIHHVTAPVVGERGPENLVLWHWRDDRLPTEKSADRRLEPIMSDLSYVSLTDGRFVRLSDETLSQVTPQRRGPYALGFDIRRFGWQNRSTSRAPQRRDYALVDLRTGRRKPILEDVAVWPFTGLAAVPQLSPDGAFLLYQDNNGDYVSIETQSGRQHNLTSKLPTKFFLQENLTSNRKVVERIYRPAVLQGWTADRTSVLVSDYYDIWILPLAGGKATNLTHPVGRPSKPTVVYSLAQLDALSPSAESTGDRIVDLRAPLYFRTQDTATARTGLARYSAAGAPLQQLRWEDAQIHYFTGLDGHIRLGRVISETRCADFYRLDSTWAPEAPLTDANPQQRAIRWSPGIRYLSYETSHFHDLHGVLHLPVGYRNGQKYPTLVSIYEMRSDTAHDYIGPSHEVFDWLQQGYAVLLPDIQLRIDAPGESVLEAVESAVVAASATGVVDPDRLGLTGYSFGAYGTYYVATHSDLFKAALPKAGIVNQLSRYGLLYGGRTPAALTIERGQGYLRSPWWEDLDIYLRESPLFHAQQLKTPLLIVHGSDDDAVPFSQGLEMFNTLRRIGGKPVVLLEYRGTDHLFDHEATTREDVRTRERQFFGHFLKGESAPRWWSDGTSYARATAPPP